jgi:hypothetical protein
MILSFLKDLEERMLKNNSYISLFLQFEFKDTKD